MLIYGTPNHETITGTDQADEIYGFAGNDWIVCGADNDRVFGGSGQDTILGGTGYDWLSGGEGDDVLHAGTEGGELYGREGNDILGAINGLVVGGTGNDRLYGGDFIADSNIAVKHATLVGGIGRDHFTFEATLNGESQHTTLADFRPRQGETLNLHQSIDPDTGNGPGEPGLRLLLDKQRDGMIDARDAPDASGYGAFLDANHNLTLQIGDDYLTFVGRQQIADFLL